MIDIRLIEIDESGTISLTSNKMHVPLTRREAAIQYVVLCLLNTPGTMVDAPSFGGGAGVLNTKMKKSFSDTKDDVAEVVHNANLSIERIGPSFREFSIIAISLVDVVRLSGRGYNASIKLKYSSGSTENITVPGQTNVNI